MVNIKNKKFVYTEYILDVNLFNEMGVKLTFRLREKLNDYLRKSIFDELHFDLRMVINDY